MNFLLRSSLFGKGSRVQLMRLLGAAVDRRHRIQIAEGAEPLWQNWLIGFDQNTREQIEGALNWSIHENAERPSGVLVIVEKRQESAWSMLLLTLDDAVDLASRPFRVFLENAASDGLFLRALMTDEERAWFDNLVAREWLVLETAGGIAEIKKWVDWVRESPSRLLRTAALFDGDAVDPPRAPRESTEQLRRRLHPNSRRALEACQSAQLGDPNAFPHHVTRRRSIENYLPIPVLERWARSTGVRERAGAQRRVAALKDFDRRHQFNMKGGHDGDRKRIPPVGWLPTRKNTPLEQGFGTDIAMEFRQVRSDELKADGAFDEFRSFIHALRKRLS